MAGIFISYRRSDAEGWAGRLYDSLKASRGLGRFDRIKIFRDIDDIPPGVEFDTYINEAVVSCDVLIAVIGPRWLTASESGRRRLDDPKDFIRLEIATALGRNVSVIPVLVGKASMPTADDLPDDIKPLARRQAYELMDNRWANDCQTLAKVLKPIVYRRRRKQAAIGVAILGLGIVGGGMLGPFGARLTRELFSRSPSSPGTPAPERPFRLRPGQLNGDWVDNQANYVWRIAHFHDVVQIDVFTPTGRFHRKGIGGVEGRVVRFSTDDNLNGELMLSEDGKFLRGRYEGRPTEPLVLEWRSE